MDINDIELKVANNQLTAMQTFTQMKQHTLKNGFVCVSAETLTDIVFAFENHDFAEWCGLDVVKTAMNEVIEALKAQDPQ